MVAEVLEAYEAKRWPDGKIPQAGKASLGSPRRSIAKPHGGCSRSHMWPVADETLSPACDRLSKTVRREIA
jgi:hypothetical protein